MDLDPGFGAAEGEMPEGLEAAIAEALDAQGPEEFFARLLGSVGLLAARPARGARPHEPIHLPIRFNANLSVAEEVAYAPQDCPSRR